MDRDDPRIAGETYLGDGVYATFDGWQIKLRAPRENGSEHVVYLEPQLYRELQRFAAACWAPLPDVDPRGLSLEALERYCRMFSSWAARDYWAYVPAEHHAFIRELKQRRAAS